MSMLKNFSILEREHNKAYVSNIYLYYWNFEHYYFEENNMWVRLALQP